MIIDMNRQISGLEMLAWTALLLGTLAAIIIAAV